ncbi:hypothetical protein J27TS8_29970 [Robertmurraya siralis]|uniref:Uncharacterized protein n=1 Tax=Robertmurraya siralis TaxID=77777 RepID=A0A920BUH6_9BACI|nr:hypothetical protein [Robertmurraya siralis]PAE19712.1 hypothetical protein CHH80_15170 [Bacillus sp. 7504-2]GIN63004.1 hypothetical protein J27TS8_29970 [Robertmurraya siralis]
MKKYNLWLILILIIHILILISCDNEKDTKKEIVKVEEESDVHNLDTEINETYLSILNEKYFSLIGKLDMDYGGYSIEPLQHQYGNLYSSYFLLNTKDILHEEINSSERNILKEFVSEQIKLIDNKSNPNVVYDLYYGTEILKMINYRDFVILKNIYDKLMKFQLEDGSFVSSYEEIDKNISDENKITSTVMAISILNTSNKEIPEKTIEWLKKTWNQIDKTDINISKLRKIIEGFEMSDARDKSEINKEIELFRTFYLNALKGNSDNGTLLYALQDAIYLDKIFEFNLTPSVELIERIYKEQNKDGGWNIFLDDFSEEQGTEVAVKVLNHFNFDIPYQDLLSKTVNEQKSINGGYAPIIQKEFSLKNTSYIYFSSQKLGLKYHRKDETFEIIQDIMSSDYSLYTSEELLQLNNLAIEFKINNNKLVNYAENEINKESKLQSVEKIYDLINFYKIINTEKLLKEHNIDSDVLDTDNYFTKLLLLNLDSIKGDISKKEINSYWGKYKDFIIKDVDKNSCLVYMLLSSLPINKEENKDVYRTLIQLINKQMSNYSQTMEPLSIQEYYFIIESINNLDRME